MKLNKLTVALAVAGLAVPGVASATNGYFSHGYGMKSKGMAGAATATASDTFGGAVNPAKMVFVGNRIDFGADVFSPRRSISRQGSGAFGIDASADSDSNYFIIPEFGYNKMLNPNTSLGVTVYGNGGMNTDFPGGQIPAATSACPGFLPGPTSYNLLCGSGKLGVDLIQLIIAPTVAYKLNPNHAIGVSPLLGYQRFKVEGLQAFAAFTPSGTTNNLTNQGYDSSTGWGVRIGWLGQITDKVSVGAAYSTKMSMSNFDKYKELFAEQGGFDIPENYNIGIALKATPKMTVALDIQQINYSDIKSINNKVANSLNFLGQNQLGTANGSGFRWRDQTVFKLGFEYEYSKNLTLRAGYNYGKSPIQGSTLDDITFNMIAPGVVEHHLTLGGTWTLQNGAELTVSYMHAFSNSVTGTSAFSAFGAPGTETLKMYQDSIGIAYGWKM